MLAKPTKKPRKRRTKTTPAAALATIDIDRRNDTLVTTEEAAVITGRSAKTLRQMRCERRGPPCFKLGKAKQARVVYWLNDIHAYLRANLTPIHQG
jgi:hypothetical protein